MRIRNQAKMRGQILVWSAWSSHSRAAPSSAAGYPQRADADPSGLRGGCRSGRSRPRELATVDEFKDSRIRLLILPQQAGGSAARNAGVGAARGSWIAFLDDDDEFTSEKLALQLESALRHGSVDRTLTVCKASIVGYGRAQVWPQRFPAPRGGSRRVSILPQELAPRRGISTDLDLLRVANFGASHPFSAGLEAAPGLGLGRATAERRERRDCGGATGAGDISPRQWPLSESTERLASFSRLGEGRRVAGVDQGVFLFHCNPVRNEARCRAVLEMERPAAFVRAVFW